MASQREYEMLFKLNAQLGGQYSSTFKQAQASMQQFREEYRSMSTTANDISAFQRQQTAVENTKAKLDLLQTQYDNIQREMEETGTFSSDLANKLAAKQAQIDKTTKAYQEQTDRLAAYKQRLEEAGVDTSHLEEEEKRLREELQKVKYGFKDASDGAKDFGDKGEASVEQIGSALAAAGIVATLKKIYDAFAECVSVTGDFEESMSNVEAISGASGEEISALTERAKELGAQTSFTAQQVSEGMSYMAMAGWDTTSMLSGMDAVLALAAASGEDLGTVSDIVTDALTAFGLKASDTAHFADVLAATATNANTNVGMMGETFKYAAPVAGALGYSIEDVSVMIGLMANSGIKASNAGTTLRNVFNGLLSGVTLTSDAFGEVEISAVNADGTMKDLGTSINELRGYFEQMSQAEQVNNAIAIAGQRGYSGLLAILNSTSEDYNKLTSAITNCSGAAQQMADIKLDNMNGQLTIAKSAWEGLEIAVGEQFQPALQNVYATFAQMTSGLTEFINQNPEVVKAIAGLTVGVGTFVAGITAYIAVTKLAKIVTDQLTTAMRANPYLLVGAALVGVVAGFAALVALGDPAETAMDRVTESTRAQQERLETLQAEYERVSSTMGETSYEAQSLKWQIDELSSELDNNAQTVQQWHDELQKNIDAHDAWVSAYQESSDAYSTEADSIEALIGKLASLSSQSDLTAGDIAQINAIVGKLNEFLPDLDLSFDASGGGLSMTAEQLREIAQATIRAKQAAADYEAYLSAVETNNAYQGELDEAKYNQLLAQNRYDAAKRAYDNADQNFMPPEIAEEYNEAWEQLEYWNGAVDTANGKLEENNAQLEELEGKITGYAEAEEAAAGSMDGVIASYTDRINELTKAYEEAYAAALESIRGQYNLWDEAAEVNATGVDSVIANLEGQQAYWENYNSNIQTLLQYSGQIEGLSEMVASFGDGSAESVNMIAGMAEALSSGDTTQLEALVQAWQDNKAAQDEAAQSLADLSTSYSDEMAKIGQEIASAVEEMDMTDESYEAATNTIQGFIDGAMDMLPAVTAAYAAVGQAAIDAVESKMDIHSPSRVMMYEAQMTWQGFIDQTRAMQSDVAGAFADTAGAGTDSVEGVSYEGVSLTPSTSSSSISVNFSPVYNISGSTNAGELEGVLAAHDEELKEQVRQIIAEEQEDAQRRAYV